LAKEGGGARLPPQSVAKIDTVRKAASQRSKSSNTAGVKMAYGSDLLGRCTAINPPNSPFRAHVQRPADIICSGHRQRRRTAGNGRKARRRGAGMRLPISSSFEGDPLCDIASLTGQGERISAIMKDGVFVKNELR